MSRYNRGNSIISRQSDSQFDEDNWMSKLQQSLLKEAVQPKAIDESMFDQINAIMNNKSKYTSVAAAVEDMKERSGLKAYLANKVSQETEAPKKIASENKNQPTLFQKCPQIKQTFENVIRDTKGNLSLPAIIDRVRSIHGKDASDSKDWDEDNLMRFVSRENLKEKQNSPDTFELNNHLGEQDTHYDDTGTTSNEDAFLSLMPAKR